MSPGISNYINRIKLFIAEDNDNMRIPFGDGNSVEDKIKTMQKDFDNYRKGGGKISFIKNLQQPTYQKILQKVVV